MGQLLKYFPLVKVDESTHTAYGLVTAEVPDKEGEICDYEAAKKAYSAWSTEAANSTEAAGQEVSYGNIRLMHQVAIGGKAVKAVEFRDKEKEIWLASTPVNDEVWSMLQKGFIRGYSQGGDYLWRRCAKCETDIPSDDGNKCPSCKKSVNVRYAPSIAEVSYVDNPCLKAATFSMVKADGSTEMRKFADRADAFLEKLDESLAGVRERAAALAKFTQGGSMADVAAAAVETPPAAQQIDIPALTKSITDTVTANLANAATEAKKAAAVAKAAEVVKSPLKFMKASIGAADGAEKTSKITAVCLEILEKGAAKRPSLAKGMYDVGRLADLLSSLAYLQISARYEADYEEDGSTLPADLLEDLESLGETFLAMAEEEVKELTAAAENKGQGGMYMSTPNGALAKASKSIAEHISKIKKLADDHRDAHHEQCDKIIKILGADESGVAESNPGGGSGEPTPVDPTKVGTEVHRKAEEPNMTKAEMSQMLKEAVKEAVDTAVAEGFTQMIKASADADGMKDCGDCGGKGKDEDGDKCERCEGSGRIKKKAKAAKAAPAAGIGDRSDVQPMNAQVRTVPVTKNQDGQPLGVQPAAPAVVTPDLVAKAVAGDVEAGLALMKGAKTQNTVPDTVAPHFNGR